MPSLNLFSCHARAKFRTKTSNPEQRDTPRANPQTTDNKYAAGKHGQTSLAASARTNTHTHTSHLADGPVNHQLPLLRRLLRGARPRPLLSCLARLRNSRRKHNHEQGGACLQQVQCGNRLQSKTVAVSATLWRSGGTRHVHIVLDPCSEKPKRATGTRQDKKTSAAWSTTTAAGP